MDFLTGLGIGIVLGIVGAYIIIKRNKAAISRL